MTRRVAFILCSSLLQFILLCSAVPLQKRTVGPGETVMQIPPRFDAGRVNSCEIPATNFCSGIDYPVPSSVARLAPIIEEEIRGEYEQYQVGDLSDCAAAVRSVRCAQRFPRCSENGPQINLTSLNCAERILDCPSFIRLQLEAEGFCTLDGTSNNVECKPVTSYNSYVFQSCSTSADWRVTEWMHYIMVHADRQVTEVLRGALGSVDSQCQQKYADFICWFNGRCTSSSEESRVQIVNTYELCEEVLNCYPDQIAASLRDLLPCHLWPSRFDSLTLPTSSSQPVVDDRTTNTESPTTSSSDTPTTATTAAAMPTWPTPQVSVISIDPSVLVGGTTSLHSVGPLLLLSIAMLVALWT